MPDVLGAPESSSSNELVGLSVVDALKTLLDSPLALIINAARLLVDRMLGSLSLLSFHFCCDTDTCCGCRHLLVWGCRGAATDADAAAGEKGEGEA
jgi:hypothetical protein